MGFRNPMYLDIPLLKNLADYYGIDVPIPRQIVQHNAGTRTRGVGVKKVLDAHMDSDKTTETTETFTTDLRPVRLVNDVIDNLLASSDVIDLLSNPDADLVSQSPIQIEGELTVSPATEIGSIVGRFFPLLIAKYAEGEDDPSFGNEDLAQFLLAPQNEGAQVYDLTTANTDGFRTVLILDPRNISEDRDCDDLEGAFTVFGIVDRLLAEGGSLSLVRYLLPGMNRVVRRAIKRASLEELLEGFGEMSGQTIDSSALSVTGPGAVIKPLAIY